MNKLKHKIIKINSYSIFLIVFIFSIFSFASVYFVLNNAFKQEVEYTKQEYISSQKEIMKNQVNNFIDFINHTMKVVREEGFYDLKKDVNYLAELLSISNPIQFSHIVKTVAKGSPGYKFGLTDMQGNLIVTLASDFKKQRRMNAIKKGFNKLIIINTPKGLKYFYLVKFKNKLNNKEYVIGGALYQKDIDNKIKKIVLDRVNNIKFGAKNRGYLSIAQILNYAGGKGFAKVVALPIKPEWVGKLLDDDKQDAKGNMYRKEYLKIANTTKSGYVSYWFFKKGSKQIRPKLSYVRLYQPFDWLIFTSVYLDDINQTLKNKEEILKNEIKTIFIYYTILSIIFLIITFIVARYENKVLHNLIGEYEKLINAQNKKLVEINKNLEKEVKNKTKELIEHLLKDKLTKLSNREKLLIDLTKYKYIALINIDSFKEINDFYGIKVGDEILQKLATLIKTMINDNAYKLSADEFAILGNNIETLESELLKLDNILQHTALNVGRDLHINISVSCGIGETLPKADMALKYAKKLSQKIVVFNDELSIFREYENNLKWRKIIKEAIKNGNILTYVQPIINNQTRKIDKYECLVRLKHEDKIYSPYFFLEISKHTNQYYDIQKIMIQNSFEKFSKLDFKFSINISTMELKNKTFKEFLLHKIDEYKVENKLIIEILEDEELSDKNILDFLTSLRQKGVQVAIDDFGSGYSNFSYLIKEVPVDILKIDGSLVKNIEKSQEDYKLLVSIVKMVKEFNFEIVAEFVENDKIYHYLKQMNVDYSQGYYFSAPIDINEL